MAATEKRPEIIELSRSLRGVPQCEDYERMISGMMYVHCPPIMVILLMIQVQSHHPKALGSASSLSWSDSRLQQPGHKDCAL